MQAEDYHWCVNLIHAIALLVKVDKQIAKAIGGMGREKVLIQVGAQ